MSRRTAILLALLAVLGTITVYLALAQFSIVHVSDDGERTTTVRLRAP